MKDKERQTKNLYNISLLNNIAIVLVILGHSGCVYAGKWNDSVFYNSSSVIRYITYYIYSFHMPLFVFISGYLYCYGKNTQNKYKSFKEFVSKKFQRLIIPYLLIGVLFMLPIKMIFHLDNVGSSYFKRVMYEIILANKPSHLWFLLMLFNLFVIFYFIEKYLSKNNIIVNLLMLFTISILVVKLPNIYQISQSLQYLLFFYLGYIFFKYKDIVNRIEDKWIWFFMAHILIFNFDYFIINSFSVSGNNLIYMKFLNLLVDKIMAFFGVIFIFTMLQFLFSKSEELIHGKLFKKMFKNNYFIYLVHQPIMLVIIKAIRNVQIKPIIVYNILFWSTLFISFSLGEIYHFMVSLCKKRCRINLNAKI